MQSFLIAFQKFHVITSGGLFKIFQNTLSFSKKNLIFKKFFKIWKYILQCLEIVKAAKNL